MPVGPLIYVTKIGKHKVKLDVENKKQELSNDNSRALSMLEILERASAMDKPSQPLLGDAVSAKLSEQKPEKFRRRNRGIHTSVSRHGTQRHHYSAVTN